MHSLKVIHTSLPRIWWNYLDGKHLNNVSLNEKLFLIGENISNTICVMSWPSHSSLPSLPVKTSPVAVQSINTSLSLHAQHSRHLQFCPHGFDSKHAHFSPSHGQNVPDSFMIIDCDQRYRCGEAQVTWTVFAVVAPRDTISWALLHDHLYEKQLWAEWGIGKWYAISYL